MQSTLVRIALFLTVVFGTLFAPFMVNPAAAAPAAGGVDDRPFNMPTISEQRAAAPSVASVSAEQSFFSAEAHYFFRSDKFQPLVSSQNVSGTATLGYDVVGPRGYTRSGTVDVSGTELKPLYDKEVIPGFGLGDTLNIKLTLNGTVVVDFTYGFPNGGPVFSHLVKLADCQYKIVGHVDPYVVVSINGVVLFTFYITLDDWESEPFTLPADLQSGELKVEFFHDESMARSRGWFSQAVTNDCYQAPTYSANPTAAINCQQQWAMINGETTPAGATFVWSLGNSGTLAAGVNEITNVATITFPDQHVETREVKITRSTEVCPIDTQYSANPTATINCKQQWAMINGETTPAGATFVWSLGNSGTLADGVNEITNVATITFPDQHVETREVKITRSTEVCGEEPGLPKTRVIIATGFQCAGSEGWVVKKETIKVAGRTYIPVETQVKWIGANKDSNIRLNNPPQIGESPKTDEGKLIVGWDKAVDLVLAATLDTREVKWFRAEEPWYDHNSIYATIRGILYEAKLVVKYKVNGQDFRYETVTQAYAVAIPSAEWFKANCEQPKTETKKICRNGQIIEVPADSTEVDDGSCTPPPSKKICRNGEIIEVPADSADVDDDSCTPPPPPALKDRCAGLDADGVKIIEKVDANSEDLDSPACTAGDLIPEKVTASQPHTEGAALALLGHLIMIALAFWSFRKARVSA